MPSLNKSTRYEVTARDRQLLKPLVHGPFTTTQLRRFSWQLDRPFTSDKYLQQRLHRLGKIGLVRCDRRYASEIQNGPKAYQLTPQGYRLLMPNEPLPTRTFFNQIGLGAQYHKHATQDTVSLLWNAFHNGGAEVIEYRRDRETRLQHGGIRVLPDAMFRVRFQQRILTFHVEVDCGSEPVYSPNNRENLCRKVRSYDELELAAKERFKVLMVFAHAPLRQSHFLDVAAKSVVMPKRRTVFYSAMIADLESAVCAGAVPVFHDHRRGVQPLLRALDSTPPKPRVDSTDHGRRPINPIEQASLIFAQ